MRRSQLEANVLTLVTLGLTAFGLVMVYSATSAKAAVGDGEPMYYLKRQAIFAGLGLIALLVFTRTGYRRLIASAPTFVAGALVLLAAVLVMGQSVNGARRWFSIGVLAVQPSELAKLALAVWVASRLARRAGPQTLKELWKPIGIVCGAACGLVLLEPDLGTAIAIVIMVVAMLAVGGSPGKLLASTVAIVTTLGILAIWFEPYRRARVFAFFNPWADAQGTGFQIVQAMISLGRGGIFGVGLGEGVGKINYLPEAHTDMIFATIGEELGLIGTGGVILAYAVFAWAGMRIALQTRDPFGKRLAAGVTALVCGQAFVNIAAVLGVAPLTGITLPFVSYGGSSLIVGLASVGLLLNIARSDDRQQRAEVRDRGRGNGGARPAVARDRIGAAGARRPRDVRRVAGSHRG